GFDTVSEVEFDAIVNQHQLPQNKIKWKDYLRNNNNALLDYISLIICQNKYDEIIVCCGSNRQNPYTDTTNSCKDKLYSGSCYEGLEIFVEEIEKIASIPVSLDRTLTADFFHKRQPGGTWARTRTWIEEEKEELDNLFEDCPNDRTKISLHYWWIHEFAKQYHDRSIDYYGIDDNYQDQIHSVNPNIINALVAAYGKKSALIPKNITFHIMPYKGAIIEPYHIPGTGIIDATPDETMHQMMADSLEVFEGIDNDQTRKTQLAATNSCDCWNLFNDDIRQERLEKMLATRKKFFSSQLTQFIEEHQADRKKSCCFTWTNLFNQENKKYETLTGQHILDHAKKLTWLGYKNRTFTILKTMKIINDNGEILDQGFAALKP
ncbi:MAG: hypothetical protein K0S63_680, partial [Gammaproteobacteria bacterium]|nr:hypothetical protein [Gammaproteobacteria bacterium]